MIRSSKHSIKFANKNKLARYAEFLAEYRRVGTLIIDDIWNNGYKSFNLKADILDLPKYLDYKDFRVETTLSARALSSLVTQISGNIRAVTEKRRKLLYVRKQLSIEGKSFSHISIKLNKTNLSKPDFNKCNPELSSKCVDIEQGKSFNYFIRLKSIGDYFGHIKIPIKNTKVSNKWLSSGEILGSFSFSERGICIRYNVQNTALKSDGEVVGLDQGILDVATMSNGKTAGKLDNHGHSLQSITTRLARKSKGSKAFKRAQIHRKNHVNWSINQLDFEGIKEIRLEKIVNIRYKKRSSRFLSHFSNPLVRDKLKRKAEEQEVLVVEQDCAYRSQRCSGCGLVRKSNRKGKVYKCAGCGLEIDSDFNAAKNHLADLLPISYDFLKQRNNLGSGFYWNPS